MPRRPQKELAAFQQSAGSATEPRSDETDDIELHLNSLPSTYGCSAGAADRGGHFDAGGLVKIGAWLGDLSDETMSVNGMLSFAEVKKSHFDQITAGADPNEVEPHVLAKPQLPVTMLLQCKACGNGQPLQANVFIFRWIDPATEKEMLNHASPSTYSPLRSSLADLHRFGLWRLGLVPRTHAGRCSLCSRKSPRTKRA